MCKPSRDTIKFNIVHKIGSETRPGTSSLGPEVVDDFCPFLIF